MKRYLRSNKRFDDYDEVFTAIINIPFVYIARAKDTIESIYGGALLRIRIHNHPHPSIVAHKCAYVTFASYKVAERALSSQLNWPNGQSIAISKEPELYPEACQPSHFDVLNADCLFHVYQYLEPMDIANASEAFKCLSQFAENNICQKYTTLDTLFAPPRNQYTMKEFKCVLKHLGGYVTDATMHSRKCCSHCQKHTIEFSMIHVSAVFLYCPKLVRTELHNFFFVHKDLETLCSMPLRASEVLFLKCCGFDRRWSELWPNWSNLQTLKIHMVCESDSFQWLETLTNIKNLSLTQHAKIVDEAHLIKMIHQNQESLTSLSMFGFDFEESIPEMYVILNEIAPNLVDLNVQTGKPAYINRLYSLKHLKRMILFHDPNIRTFFKGGPWRSYFDTMETLDELTIVNPSNECINTVFMVPKLRVLSLMYPSRGLEIPHVIASLTILKRLKLGYFNEWSDIDTINVLEHNHSIEHIEFDMCSYTPSFTRILELLTKQANSRKPPRRTVHLSVNDLCGNAEPVDIDHNLLKISTHYLNRVSKRKWDIEYFAELTNQRKNVSP